jgi:hypothetical protein
VACPLCLLEIDDKALAGLKFSAALPCTSRRPRWPLAWPTWSTPPQCSPNQPASLAEPGAAARGAREFHLDAATFQYRVESFMEHGVGLTYPFRVAVPFEELVE